MEILGKYTKKADSFLYICAILWKIKLYILKPMAVR